MLNLFYRAKWLKHVKQNSALPFYTALLSMVLCMVCLAGTTWAWFTANQAVEVTAIQSAQWIIESVEVVQLSDENSDLISISVSETQYGKQFDAAANTKYLVTVSATGNASTGYLLVKTYDGNYYTRESSISFELCLSQDGPVEISASWGVYTGEAVQLPAGQNIGKGTILVSSEEQSLQNDEDTIVEETTEEISD